MAQSETSERKRLAALKLRQQAIGRRLRLLFDEAVEPVPDDMIESLRAIDRSGRKDETS